MTIEEQIWFLVALGGFLYVIEGVIAEVCRLLSKMYPKIAVSEQLSKVIGGLVLLIIAILNFKTLPLWLSLTVAGLLVLEIVALVNPLRVKEKRRVK